MLCRDAWPAYELLRHACASSRDAAVGGQLFRNRWPPDEPSAAQFLGWAARIEPARKRIAPGRLQACSTTYTRGVVVRMDEISTVTKTTKHKAIIARLSAPRTELRYNYTE